MKRFHGVSPRCRSDPTLRMRQSSAVIFTVKRDVRIFFFYYSDYTVRFIVLIVLF